MFSEMDAAIAANIYNCREFSVTVIAALQQIYIDKTLNKVWNALTFMNDHTDGGFFKLRQVSDTLYLKKSSYYKMVDGQKIEDGWQSLIQGITADKPNKIRGDRTDMLIYEEGGCHIVGTLVLMYDGTFKNVENIQLGDLLMGDDGTSREVIELHSGVLPMYKITLENGDTLIVNENHILYGKKYIYHKKEYNEFLIKIKDFYDMIKNSPRKKDGYKLIKSNKVKFPYKEVPLDPYLFGFWLGDGSSDAPRFTNEDPEIIEYLKDFANTHNMKYNECDCSNSKKCKHIYLGRGNNSSNYITDALRELNVLNNKHIPDCYIYNSDEVLLLLLAGFIDSDGTYNKTKREVEITLSEERKHIIDLLTTICHILGMRVSNSVRISKERKINGKTIKGGVNQYRLKILYGHSRIPVKIERKKSEDRENKKNSSVDRNGYSFKIEPVEQGQYYGFSLTGNQLFLLKDFTVCHNSWPQLTKAFIQGDALVGIQGRKFGIKIVGGTGGDTGPALEGLRDIYYNPDVYDVLPYRHNYTYTGEEALTGFFIPAFNVVNTPECMDKRGYTNPIKGKEFYDKLRAKKSKDPKALITYSAEYCYNAEEAFSLEGDNKFNKVNIAEQLTLIRVLKKCPEIQTGFLEYKFKEGKHAADNIDGFKWIPNLNGKIKIYEHPIWTIPDKIDPETGKTIISNPREKIRNLYVIGIDGIDIGKDLTSDSTKDPSDFCLVVKKRVYGLDEPKYVAMYKDRPNDIREAYKIAIKLAQYYNAQINIEATRQSIIPWAREKKVLNYFMKRPLATLSEKAKNNNSKLYGTPATENIILHLTDLIADYVEDYCYTIWFEEMLDELNRYTYENKRKFDIIAAMAMAELADEELMGIIPKVTEIKKDIWQDIGYYTDEYGNRRYGKIPNSLQVLFNYNFEKTYDDIRIRTSDPRFNM